VEVYEEEEEEEEENNFHAEAIKTQDRH